MKQGWLKDKLSNCFNLKSGEYLSGKMMINGVYPVYGGNGIAGAHNNYNLSGKNIIIGRVGALCGNTRYIDCPIWVTDNAFYVTNLKYEFDYRFLTYQLNYINLRQYARQAAQPVISNSSLKDVFIKVPPLFEQQRIVEILDEAFGKIDTVKQNAERNLKNAKELFQSVLDFELRLKEGWEEKKLPQISDNLDSKRVPITKNKRTHGDYPYYGASGIVDYVSEYLFDEDLLLISEDGANLLARTYPIAFSVNGKIWVNNHAHVLRFSDINTQRFVEYYFSSIKIDNYVTGMAQPKLNQNSLNSIAIPVPPLPKQQAIVSKLDALSEKCKTLENNYLQTIKDCDELKKAILTKAFNGEL